MGEDPKRAEPDPIPHEFRRVFRALVIALRPRYLEPDTVAVYWTVLGHLSLDHLRQSADALKQRATFFPTTGEWMQAARAVGGDAIPIAHEPDHEPDTVSAEPFVAANGSLIPIDTTLDDLDQEGLSFDDRNEISKRLTPAAQTALMARYGYPWPPR